jgi:hypothetical protein
MPPCIRRLAINSGLWPGLSLQNYKMNWIAHNFNPVALPSFAGIACFNTSINFRMSASGRIF